MNTCGSLLFKKVFKEISLDLLMLTWPSSRTFFGGGGGGEGKLYCHVHFYCYANFSIVFGSNFFGRETNCPRGHTPVEESQLTPSFAHVNKNRNFSD